MNLKNNNRTMDFKFFSHSVVPVKFNQDEITIYALEDSGAAVYAISEDLPCKIYIHLK